MFLVLTTSTAGASSTCSLLKSAENTSPVGTFSRCLRAIFVLFYGFVFQSYQPLGQ